MILKRDWKRERQVRKQVGEVCKREERGQRNRTGKASKLDKNNACICMCVCRIQMYSSNNFGVFFGIFN